MIKSRPQHSGRGSARLERTVRVREVRGSNPRAPTEKLPLKEREFFYSKNLLKIGLILICEVLKFLCNEWRDKLHGHIKKNYFFGNCTRRSVLGKITMDL